MNIITLAQAQCIMMKDQQALSRDNMAPLKTSRAPQQGHIIEDVDDPEVPKKGQTVKPRSHQQSELLQLPPVKSSVLGSVVLRSDRSSKASSGKDSPLYAVHKMLTQCNQRTEPAFSCRIGFHKEPGTSPWMFRPLESGQT